MERGLSVVHDFDEKTGVVFNTLIAQNAISCWNSNVQYTPENQGIIFQNNVTLNYPADVRVR